MSDKPSSPFAKLDTNLLRSTRPREDVPSPEGASATAAPSPASAPAAATRSRDHDTKRPPRHESMSPGSREPVIPRYPDTTTPEDTTELVGVIRRVVRVVGKEGATLRLTAEEKARLADVIYAYKRKGKRTSETEIIRIALNYVLTDLERNGDRSILSQVLEALDA